MVKYFEMKTGTHWQRIAERLAESGWSWQHVRLTDRVGRTLYVAEAHNDYGEKHVAVAPSIGPAFFALERSVKSAGK